MGRRRESQPRSQKAKHIPNRGPERRRKGDSRGHKGKAGACCILSRPSPSPGQHGRHSPLRSAAPPRMIRATTTAPECSSRRMVAPCIGDRAGRLLRGSPKPQTPRLWTPESLPVSPSVTAEGRPRAALSSAEDAMKPASHVNTAQQCPHFISEMRDRGSEKVSIPEVAQLGRCKGLWDNESSACLSHHSPCLLQRHLIIRRERACKFSTSNQSQGTGLSVVAKGNQL